MKELRIPSKENNIVDISEINDNYKGVIICYKNGSEIGMITSDQDSYYFSNRMDITNYLKESYTLLDLCNTLIDEKICDVFKVITFND